MSAASPDVFACGLCGLEFTHGDQACASCAIGAGCDLVKCPRCGYQFPRTSRVLGLLHGLTRLVGARW